MSEYAKALEAQRRAFEASFGSLEELGFEDKTKIDDVDDEIVSEEDEALIEYDGEDPSGSSSESEEDSMEEFEGFSDADNEEGLGNKTQKAVVVKFKDTEAEYTGPSKRELKSIRSGKVLTIEQQRARDEEILKQQAKQHKDTNDEENLKNDLELQRLLKESHFLNNTKNDFSGAELTLQTMDYDDPIGASRKRALSSRMDAISEVNSKMSHKKLEKMPMSMRKGMISSTKQKIEKYERDARENGIVLSKVKKGQLRDLSHGKGSTSAFERIGTGEVKKQKMRQRGLKINAVGRSTRNGLILSSKDLEKITGPSLSNTKKGKKRGRR